MQEKVSNSKVDLHSLELDKNNIEPQLDKLASIEEEYVLQKQKKEENFIYHGLIILFL